MTVTLKKPAASATPIHVVDAASFAGLAAQLPAPQRRWLATVGFSGQPDTHALLPAEDGGLAAVWAGVAAADHPFALSALPRVLPAGRYRLAEGGLNLSAEAAAHSWALGGYRFSRYKRSTPRVAELQLPPSAAARHGLLLAEAAVLARDLVNTPAEHMGPADLAQAVQAVATAHGAKVRQTIGEALLKARLPAIHAVGRAAAADRAPRLIELTWGSSKHPRLSLVGKGVCFDTGGLDIKGPEGMRQMKKDMGGAANALALAQLVMALKLPVHLQLLIPAVENAIAGNAYRPGDIVPTRAGLQVEIGNTDAEGRVILCDALACAVEGQPDLLIDLATLTGAARVALGGQLPALFCRRMDLARQLVDDGLARHDPLWHLPLWAPYHGGITSDLGDIVNTGRGPQGGAINAALFLADFVPDSCDWLHIDLYAWNDAARPGRPAGGELQTVRTLIAHLQQRYPGRQASGRAASATAG